MRSFRTFLHRLGGLFRRRTREAEMQAEMQSHLDALAERNIANGLSPEEARYAAQRTFGGVTQLAEKARDEWRLLWLEQLGQDVRYAVRALKKSPTFTITAVLTLALGIGVNAALFSVFNMVALRPLPVTDPESLVRVSGRTVRGAQVDGFSYQEYLTYRTENRTLTGLIAFYETAVPLQIGSAAAPRLRFEGGGPGTVPIELVSENYFSVLGGRILLGRGFLDEEMKPGSAPVIVLSHLFWRVQLNSDRNVLGTTLTLDGRAITVIGVASPQFSGRSNVSPAGWLPLTVWSDKASDYSEGGPAICNVIGRLSAGTSEAQAKADLDLIAAGWAARYPADNAKVSILLKRGLRLVNIPVTAKSLAAFSPLVLAFTMVLVIACTNVANLLLARGVSRQQEIGVRLTLGASRARIVRQLLTENLLLSTLGAIVGLGIGTWMLQAILPRVLTPYFSPATLLSFKPFPDLRVLAFTALLTMGATLIAGLLPALQAARVSVIAAVHNQGTLFGRRMKASRLRHLLVITQVATCMMLLSCAGVLARNFFAPRELDRGFDTRGVFGAEIKPNSAIADRNDAFRRALETVGAIPGVKCGAANPPPFEVPNGMPTRLHTLEGPTNAEGEVPATFATGGFFEAFGIRLLRGRTFRDLEQQASSRMIIVSESLARQLWPTRDAVGQRLAVSEEAWSSREKAQMSVRECEVIGIVSDATLQYSESDGRQLYLPFPLDTSMYAAVFVRPASPLPTALAEVSRAAEVSGVGVQFGRPLSAQFEQSDLLFYGFAMLSSALGALALALATVGLYGLMTFAVSQRVREIGIRMALGGAAETIARLYVRQGMRLVAIGVALGLVGGALFALLLQKVLFGLVHAFDPVAYGLVTVLFAAIAFLACWLPARRSTKVDPMIALRAE